MFTDDFYEEAAAVEEIGQFITLCQDFPEVCTIDVKFHELSTLIEKLKLSLTHSKPNKERLAKAIRIGQEQCQLLIQQSIPNLNNYLEQDWQEFVDRKKNLPSCYKESLKEIEQSFLTTLVTYSEFIYQRVKDKLSTDSFFTRMNSVIVSLIQPISQTRVSINKYNLFLPALRDTIAKRDGALTELENQNRRKTLTIEVKETITFFSQIKSILATIESNPKEAKDLSSQLSKDDNKLNDVFLTSLEELDGFDKSGCLSNFLGDLNSRKEIVRQRIIRLIKHESSSLNSRFNELLSTSFFPSVATVLLLEDEISTAFFIKRTQKKIEKFKDQVASKLFPIQYSLLLYKSRQDEFLLTDAKTYVDLIEKVRTCLQVFDSNEQEQLSRFQHLRKDLIERSSNDLLEKYSMPEILSMLVTVKKSFSRLRQQRGKVSSYLSEKSDKIANIVEEIKAFKQIIIKLLKHHNVFLKKIEPIIELSNSSPELGITQQLGAAIKRCVPLSTKLNQAWLDYRKGEGRAIYREENFIELLELIQDKATHIRQCMKTITSEYRNLTSIISDKLEFACDRDEQKFMHDFHSAVSVFDDFPNFHGELERRSLQDYLSYRESLLNIYDRLQDEISVLNNTKCVSDLARKIIALSQFHRELFTVVRSHKNKPWVVKLEQFFQDLIPGVFTPPFQINLFDANEKLNSLRRAELNRAIDEMFAEYESTKEDSCSFIKNCRRKESSLRDRICQLERALPDKEELSALLQEAVRENYNCQHIVEQEMIAKTKYRQLTKELSFLLAFDKQLDEYWHDLKELVIKNVNYICHMREHFFLSGKFLQALAYFNHIKSLLNSNNGFESLLNVQPNLSLLDLKANGENAIRELEVSIEAIIEYEQLQRQSYQQREDSFLEKMLSHSDVFISFKPLNTACKTINASDYVKVLDGYLDILDKPLKEKWFIPCEELLAKAESLQRNFVNRRTSAEVAVIKEVLINIKEEHTILSNKDPRDKRLILLSRVHDELVCCLHHYFSPPERFDVPFLLPAKDELLSNVELAIKRTLYEKSHIEELSAPENQELVNFVRSYVIRPLVNLLANHGLISEKGRAVTIWGASALETKVSVQAKKLLTLRKQNFFKPAPTVIFSSLKPQYSRRIIINP